ncbi:MULTISPECIES: hypothetical protein [Luteimonas]|uniref:hypothetical protein n=1 Tax=Luteimonas TaxID=83614 RepID=UPI001180ABFA|nr:MULTISPECIES: hypothetical protein [Luteimonas]
MARQRDREPVWNPALLGTLALHAAAGWWLWQTREPPVVSPAGAALQVVWIARPVASPSPSPSPVAVPAQRDPHERRPAPAVATTGSRPRNPTPDPAPSLDAGAPEADAPSPGASLREQARDWARREVPSPDFVRDPLQHRPPPSPDGRFAMREPLSTEDVVLAIGSLFGGGPSDPCPRIRRNIAHLGTGGDAALLAEELRRLQQYCR